MPQIAIDQNYFKKSLNDYSDYKQAWVRELMQNTIDSGSSKIKVDISHDDKKVTVACENDGRPMNYEIITQKLLSIGGTTKTGSCDGGEVGGFGVASILLYMAQDGYKIESGEWVAEGEGGSYEIEKSGYHTDGTNSIVTIKSSNPERLGQEISHQFVKFASFAQWKGQIELTFEGRTRNLACSLQKGYFRNELEFGRLYTNKAYDGLLIFRINGIPMFTKSIDYPGCAIFESTKGSLDLMTSNRDSLKYHYQWKIDDVIKRFGTNRSSVLNKSPIYEIFGNTLMGVETPSEPTEAPAPPKARESQERAPEGPAEGIKQFADAAARMLQQHPDLEELDQDDNAHYVLNRSRSSEGPLEDSIANSITANHDSRPARYTRKFMILNESGMVTPEYIRPDKMSNYCQKLLAIWTNLMCTTYRTNKASGNFAVGFCLGDALAKHVNRDGITYYLINPFEIVEQAASNSRSFKRKYHLVQDREDLIMSAVHEFIHGEGNGNGNGLQYHDETFSSVLTTLAGVAMKNNKEYKKCFRNV